MNVEKQISITQLKGKFTKDLDPFNKMDVFLEMSVGKSTARTETAQEMGKEPIWKNGINLNYFDQSHIVIKAYDQDPTENQYIGTGKLQIKSLRIPGGVIEVIINDENGEYIGTITGKYTLKNLTQSPLLILKNFKLELFKENTHFLKVKPFLQVSTDQATAVTEPKQEVAGTSCVWGESLRLKIIDTTKIVISLVDKEDSSSNIFVYECSAKQFRLQNGTKKFNVLDQGYNLLGQLIIDFETIGLVSKEESVKNIQKEKKAQNQLTAITLERVSTELPKENIDVYYKFIVGNNVHTTEVIKQATKTSALNLNQTLYAEPKENKLIIVVYEKGTLTDNIIGVGKVMLESLSSGEKKVNLQNIQNNQQVGSVTLNLTVKQTPCKSVYLDNISIEISEEKDIIGTPEPYLLAKVGSCSGRTETGSQLKTTYKKAIELKFGNEENISLEIWDEDVGTSVLLFSETIALNSFKSVKGEHSVNLTRQQTEKAEESKGKVVFRYELKGITLESARKPSQKKIQTNRTSKQPSVKQELVKKQTITAREKSQAEEESSKDKKHSIASQEAELISHRVEKEHSLNKDSLSKSKETLNLPSIMSSFHQVYGDRIFNKQSAATLQRSILVYSMPKANRFANEPKYSGEPSYCIDSCFKPNPSKGVGFGYGKKKQFPEWMERNMKENPAPGSYFQSHYEFRSKGPTFGLGHKYYQRVMIPRQQKQQQHTLARKLSPIRDPPKK